jgi:hypothetical protein
MNAMDVKDWRPSAEDFDIYRALIGRRTQADRTPMRFAWASPLRRWARGPWLEAMVASIIRRAREGADRLAR